MLTITPWLLQLYSAQALTRAAVRTSAVSKKVRQRYAAMISPLSKREIIDIMSEIVRGLHPEPNYRIGCPIAIAYGAKDNLGKIRNVAAPWAERDGVAGALLVVPEAGHLANMDNPPAFNRFMMDFLSAHYPPTPASA